MNFISTYQYSRVDQSGRLYSWCMEWKEKGRGGVKRDKHQCEHTHTVYTHTIKIATLCYSVTATVINLLTRPDVDIVQKVNFEAIALLTNKHQMLIFTILSVGMLTRMPFVLEVLYLVIDAVYGIV